MGRNEVPFTVPEMRIILLQTIGGITELSDAGGAMANLIDLLNDWVALGSRVELITANPVFFSARLRPEVMIRSLPSLSARGGPPRLLFGYQALCNPLIQTNTLRDICRSLSQSRLGRGLVAVSTSPYPSDLIALKHVVNSLLCPGVVYFYHVVPPPWWKWWRRGSAVRNSLAWLNSMVGLLYVKITGVHPGLCQPSILAASGWRFESKPVYTYGFLPRFLRRASQPWGSRRTLACTIGRLAPSKGVVDLVRVWPRVVRECPDARLVIAGPIHSDSYARRIRRMIRASGLENAIVIRGRVSEADKAALLGCSRVFVSTSYEEGWSLSVVEALNAGTRAVVYDLPAYNHLSKSVTRVTAGDLKALAQEIVQALRMSEGPDRAAFGDLFEKYSAGRVASAQLQQLSHLNRGHDPTRRETSWVSTEVR